LTSFGTNSGPVFFGIVIPSSIDTGTNCSMIIVVASRNPVKIDAVKQAFSSQFPWASLKLSPVDVDSGVSEQPDSDQETRRGARNRVAAAKNAQADADFWVGMEGGIETIDDKLVAFAWMAIRGRNGEIGEARTVTLPLPPAVKELVDKGLELGEANDRVFATTNSKQRGGAFGLLTDGRYTREFIYNQTLTMALIPFVNDLFPQSRPD
jgi:inosine/xanthosine triphosphatase